MRAPKQEVLSPTLAPRVEEGHKLATDRIHARQVRALAKIAAMAGQRKIVNVVAPAMLPGDDVLDVVRQLAVILAQQAILAAVARSLPDKVSRGGIHR
jgi:hypothetical protein